MVYNRTEAKVCVVKENILLICGGTNNPVNVELIAHQRNKTDDENTKHIQDAGKHLTKVYPYSRQNTLVSQVYCEQKLPIPLFFGHSVITTGYDGVILIGGAVEMDDDNGWGNAWDGTDQLTGTPTNRVFRGKIKDMKTAMIWREVESMKYNRLRHTSFKIKNNIYVMGGHETRICERFDLKEDKWFTSYTVPSTFCCSPYSAIVSEDESFAVLICDHIHLCNHQNTNTKSSRSIDCCQYSELHFCQRQINIFTENGGFKTIPLDFLVKRNYDNSKKLSPTFRHFTSLQLKI